MDLIGSRSGSLPLDLPARTLRPRPSGLTLWRPDIVLPESVVTVPERGSVVIAEPALRPEAVRAQIDATRTALASLAQAREALGARAAGAEARALAADTERGRVAAMMETYRVKTALEDVLRGTLRQMSAFMGERGRR